MFQVCSHFPTTERRSPNGLRHQPRLNTVPSMQTFADDPNALRADTPPLPDRPGWELGFTFLDFGAAGPDRPLRIEALAANPFMVHHLVGPDGAQLAGTGYGITLDPGGQLFHWGRVYFPDLDDALRLADRLLSMRLNWIEETPGDAEMLEIGRIWKAAADAGQLADGATLPANWPPFDGGPGGGQRMAA